MTYFALVIHLVFLCALNPVGVMADEAKLEGILGPLWPKQLVHDVVVVDANGNPVKDAQITFVSTDMMVVLRDGEIRDPVPRASSDVYGQASINFPPDPVSLLVIHDRGVRILGTDEILDAVSPIRIALKPWGAVSGVVYRNGIPVVGGSVRLKSGHWLASTINEDLEINDHRITDAEGRFTFDRVVPGKIRVIRSLPRKPSVRWILEGTFTETEVAPGRSVAVELGKPGRDVAGTVAFADEPTDAGLGLSEALVTLTLRDSLNHIGPKRGMPESLVQAPAVERAAWRETFDRSAGYIPYIKAQSASIWKQGRDINGMVAADGSFLIMDVPPGDYELRIEILRENPETRMLSAAASVSRPVDVKLNENAKGPGGVLNLGRLVMWTRPAFEAGEELDDFAVTNLRSENDNAKTVSLNSLRGKYVVVDVWGTWCGPCLRATPILKAAAERYSRSGNDEGLSVAWLTISLDEKQQTAKDYVTRTPLEQSWNWTDAWVAPAQRTAFEQAVPIAGLPSIWLIDPRGILVAHDHDPHSIVRALDAALAE